MADVFISYAREDRDRARDLAGHLEDQGWTVWWDRKLVAGQNFDEILTHQLQIAKSVVVLWSSHSIASVWVKNEATLADRRGVLIPTRIEVVDLPMPFQLKETVDLSTWDGDATSEELQFLFDSIKAGLESLAAGGAAAEASDSADGGDRRARASAGSPAGRRRWRPRRKHLAIAGLVVAIAGTLIAMQWRSMAPSLDVTARFMRASDTRGAPLPIDAALLRRVQDTRKELLLSLKPDLVLPDPENASLLSVAQTVVADVDQFDTPPERRDEVARFFRTAAKADCSCWTEVTKSDGPPLPNHIPATAWTLYALAEAGIAASDAEIGFLLQEQSPAGWWAFFPVPDERYASAYATAWALLALEHQRSRDLLPATLSDRVAAAIVRGSDWLAANHEPGVALWKNYPYLPNGTVSRSISGVALHALHRVAPKAAVPLEKQWLDALSAAPAAADGYADYYWIPTRNGGPTLESYMHVDLPWMLIATADAYSQGGRMQRARALTWLEHALDQPSVLQESSRLENWWRAELLISINYVLDRGAPDEAAQSASAAATSPQ